MTLSLRPVLAGALLCLFGVVATAFATAPAASLSPEASPFGGREKNPIDELVARIEAQRGRMNPRLFRQLTEFKNKESLEAMMRVSKGFQHPNVVDAVYLACENYVGVPDVEKRAVTWLAEEATKGQQPVRRAAAHALSRFGPAAESEARTLVKRSKDEVVRAWSLAPLLPQLASDGTPGSLELILDNGIPGKTAKRTDLLTTLEAFDGGKVNQVFSGSLRDKKTSPVMKVLIIEAIADREESSVTKALIGALRDSNSDVQVAAMLALDERDETTHASALKKLLKSDSEVVRRQAVISLGRLGGTGDGWFDELQDLATAKDPCTRQGAAVALASLRTPDALDQLYLLLADPDHIVRREALQQIGNLRRKESLPALMMRLNGEKGRLKVDLATTLRLITGLDHGTSYERWKRWWDNEGEAFVVPDYETALKAERERKRNKAEGNTVASFYGLKIVSDRICFVLDVSGSMETQSGRGNRLDAAKEQLLGVLEKFPEGELFNVVFFSSDAFPWQDELVRMDKKMRKEAVQYVERQKPGGATAVYEALQAAFEDRRVDTIYLLTDGQPTGGAVNDPAEIRAEVRRWNEARHVKIHCIAVGEQSQLLKGLAKDTGGEYKEVR